MWEGVGVDDERLALELTRQEGPRGDYLTQAHTAKHCRTEPWDARFLGPHIPVSTGGDPDRDLFERIEEELCNILERHQPEPMPPRVRAALRGLQDDFEATHSVQE
jgi:trimethylamine:corrinoid methyltransferase-like protein